MLTTSESLKAASVFSESFESPVVSNSPFFQIFGEGTSVGAFDVDNEFSVTLENSFLRGRQALDGNQVLILGRVGDGGYESRITTTLVGLEIGQEYELDFHYSSIAFAGHYGTVTLKVELGLGNLLDQFSFTVPDLGQGLVLYGTPQNPWSRRSVRFIAGEEAYSLAIEGRPVGRIGPYAALDLIEINAVPECTRAYLLAGGLFLLTARKRKKR